jgi:hypothetical protein
MRSICGALATSFVLAAMMACSKGDTTDRTAKSDSAGSSASAPAMAAAAAPVSPAPSFLPGALPKPLDQMTGDELYAFTRTLSFGGGVERGRRCRGRAACNGARPTDTTLVRVDAVEGQDSLGVSSATANGVISVRALNRGTMQDSMYNTRPGKDLEYYVVVLKGQPGTAGWQLVELTTTPGARSHRNVASGNFHPCNHAFRRGAHANFKTCDQAEQMHLGGTTPTVEALNDSPIWVDCDVGCCTMDPGDTRG